MTLALRLEAPGDQTLALSRTRVEHVRGTDIDDLAEHALHLGNAVPFAARAVDGRQKRE